MDTRDDAGVGETSPRPRAALQLDVVAECSVSAARAAVLRLPHSVVATPIFMPVGTQGTMKGITTEQLRELGCQLMLGNTYHLGLRPGPDILAKADGLHKFMSWDRSLLTDSGGFQMVSLLSLANITDQGVHFRSPHDGSDLLLTPEKSIELQNTIGADIMMQLDDVISSTVTGPRVKEAMHRSIDWLDRCIQAHRNPERQNLFAIIQGGMDLNLRRQCIQEMVKRDLPGYAIGGLSGGEEKDVFWRVVRCCTELLPADKPRYLMGVGYAVDMVVCMALGVDMFDCVFPTRTARFGNALVRTGSLALKRKEFAQDYRPISDDCGCHTCLNYTRAFLHGVVTKETVACHLLTVHNIAYQLRLSADARASIVAGRFPAFVRDFLALQYREGPCPEWVHNALASVGITLEGNGRQAE